MYYTEQYIVYSNYRFRKPFLKTLQSTSLWIFLEIYVSIFVNPKMMDSLQPCISVCMVWTCKIMPLAELFMTLHEGFQLNLMLHWNTRTTMSESCASLNIVKLLFWKKKNEFSISILWETLNWKLSIESPLDWAESSTII